MKAPIQDKRTADVPTSVTGQFYCQDKQHCSLWGCTQCWRCRQVEQTFREVFSRGVVMTKEELMKLATTMAEAEMRINVWSQQQAPKEPEKRIMSDAQYRIAQSLLDKARCEYQAAINNLTAAELYEIMRSG